MDNRRPAGGDSGMSRGHQGVQREERTTTMVDTKKGSIYNQNGVFIKKGRLNWKGRL